MDLSGVIFVVLALVWAAYLLPKALRHHDEVARTRSVGEVSEQARVVVTAPPRAASRPGRVRRTRTSAAERRAALTPGARAARRRRRILAVLLLACVGTGVAAALTTLPGWAPAVPGVLLLGFLVLCGVIVRRDRARRLAARSTTAPVSDPRPGAVSSVGSPAEQPANRPAGTASAPSAPSKVLIPAPDTVSDAAPAVVSAPVAASTALVGSLDDTTTFRELVVGVPAQSTGSPAGSHAGSGSAGSLWDPLPMTLPTYVGKQRAMRSVRTISLGDPGVSSSGRDAGDSALVASAASGDSAQPGDGSQRVVGG